MNSVLEKIYNNEMPVTKVIQQSDAFKVIAIGLNTDVKLKKHTAPDRAKLMVLQGEVVYKNEHSDIKLKPFDEYEIPLNEEHEVAALEPSLCLLIIG